MSNAGEREKREARSVDAGRDEESRTWRDNLPPWAEDITERTRGFDPDNLSTGQVVGIATGAAVALGTLVVALGPPEPDQPRQPARRVTAGADDEAVVAVVKGGKLTGRSRKGLRRQADELGAELTRLDDIVKRQAREERGVISAENVLVSTDGKERVNVTDESVVAVLKNGKLTRRSRKQLHKQVDTLQKDIDRLDKAIQKEAQRARRQADAEEARAAAGTVSENLGKRLAGVGAATAAAVAPLRERARNAELPDQVRDSARQFAGATRERTADLTERVRSDFVPLVADRASKVQERGQEVASQVASRVREDILPQVAEVASKAGTQVGALAATGAAASRETAKTIASGDMAKKVGKQTRRGRKGAASALTALAAQIEPPKEKSNALNGLWIFAIVAAIGGALYYFVFQNEERRKKVIETTQSIVEQGREIVRDFQGYDEEF